MKDSTQTRKTIIIVAGPNGAGKTTFAQEFLPREAGCSIFINADLIAAGLSPFSPQAAAIRAARLMLAEMDRCVRAGQSFAFETTLSGRNYVRRIHRWKRLGYRIEIIFLWLPTPETAIQRVKARVRQGGHDVPQQVIRRRFAAGRHNFVTLYKPLADAWSVYDNRYTDRNLLEQGTNP